MKQVYKISSSIIMLLSAMVNAQEAKYKCTIQMNNYDGLEAYMAISFITPEGKYEKTLQVLGDEEKYHDSLEMWYARHPKKENISAITGASIGAGDRKSLVISLDEAKLNKGYKIRFETAVEDGKYHRVDAEIPFSKETQKANGKGYVKTVQIKKVE